MSKWPRAVLFDFDGVLANSEPLHLEAMRAVLETVGIGLSDEQYYHECIGFDDRGAIRRLFALNHREMDPKTLLSLLTRKSELMLELIHRRHVAALPGVEELVRGLWRNYPLAICSGAPAEEIEAMLEGIALRDCFSVIVAAEDVTVGKPDPQGYRLAMQKLSRKIREPLAERDCLVIEDAPTVIASVKAAGFPTLGVATTYFIDRLNEADWAVRTLEPDRVLEVLGELELYR